MKLTRHINVRADSSARNVVYWCEFVCRCQVDGRLQDLGKVTLAEAQKLAYLKDARLVIYTDRSDQRESCAGSR